MATEVTQSEAVWGAVMTSALKGGAQGWAERGLQGRQALAWLQASERG